MIKETWRNNYPVTNKGGGNVYSNSNWGSFDIYGGVDIIYPNIKFDAIFDYYLRIKPEFSVKEKVNGDIWFIINDFLVVSRIKDAIRKNKDIRQMVWHDRNFWVVVDFGISKKYIAEIKNKEIFKLFEMIEQ